METFQTFVFKKKIILQNKDNKKTGDTGNVRHDSENGLFFIKSS